MFVSDNMKSLLCSLCQVFQLLYEIHMCNPKSGLVQKCNFLGASSAEISAPRRNMSTVGSWQALNLKVNI